MNIEHYIPVISDLTVVPSITCSKDIISHCQDAVSETVGNIRLYLEVPDEVKKRLAIELPEMNKKIVKVKSEIEKLMSKMSGESYQTKSISAREVDVAKVPVI